MNTFYKPDLLYANGAILRCWTARRQVRSHSRHHARARLRRHAARRSARPGHAACLCQRSFAFVPAADTWQGRDQGQQRKRLLVVASHHVPRRFVARSARGLRRRAHDLPRDGAFRHRHRRRVPLPSQRPSRPALRRSKSARQTGHCRSAIRRHSHRSASHRIFPGRF